MAAATGNAGGATARTLLKAGKSARDCAGQSQDIRLGDGVELALPDVHDAAALKRGLHEVHGFLVMIPPSFAPRPRYPEAKAIVAIRKNDSQISINGSKTTNNTRASRGLEIKWEPSANYDITIKTILWNPFANGSDDSIWRLFSAHHSFGQNKPPID